MPQHPPKRSEVPRIQISRRELLKSGLVLATAIPLPPYLRAQGPQGGIAHWPSYILRREVDELFLELTAIGYRETKVLGVRNLEPLKGFEDPCLVFTFPPQHFAEFTIGVQRIPTSLPDKELSRISLFPSRPSRLVFRVPQRKKLRLDLKKILDWKTFELVLPDLDHLGADYDLDVPANEIHPFTRVEIPWGIYLTPIGSYGKARNDGGQSFQWEHAAGPITSGPWTELWSTALENSADGDAPNQFEILGVRGFERKSTTGTVSGGDLVVKYSDDLSDKLPDWLGRVESPNGTAPIGNFDRVELASSLSRRFRYTGIPNSNVNTAQIYYDSKFNANKVSVGACFDVGRTVTVDEFRLSPRGGSLELDNKWKVFPGCGLTGWKDFATGGRDDEVQLVRAGFLFPFGVEAEVVARSERVFVKDEEGHFVAVLVKQAFIRVPQPNGVEIECAEALFRSVSITTKTTPPLDLPASGDPDEYGTYDYFLPTVDMRPFEFEHVGIDWAGDSHPSKMPMFFVSNRTRSPNGLIWEPGDPDAWKANRQPSLRFPIPVNGEGLRVLDAEWNKYPYRFAPYGGASIAVAVPSTKGDTTQRVEWVEWTRGCNPTIDAVSRIAPRPFQPRVRTMKIRIQGMSQFSGEDKFSLATYRDTRFTRFPVLDPEPNASRDLYVVNLPTSSEDSSAPYLYLLETRALRNENSHPSPDTEQQVLQRIRSIYYGTQAQSLVSDFLLSSINNEIQFGVSSSSDGMGGLSVPDTHVVTLTRRYGPIGDATFNVGRWDGYPNRQTQLAARSRLDYAAYRLQYRAQIDVQPFDVSLKQTDIDALQKSAAALMGFTPVSETVVEVKSRLDAAASPGGAGLSLGDLFGGDAQVLPGLSFADIFKNILMRDTSSAQNVTDTAAIATQRPSADPLQWNLRITGIDWLLQLIGNGPDQFSLRDLANIAAAQGQAADTSQPVALGVEASLDWSNEAFEPVTIEPVAFNPITGQTKIEINARAKTSLGLSGLPENLSDLKLDPGKAEVSAHAELKDFIVVVFNAIEIEFASVAFTLQPDGRKDFSPNIRDVRFKGALEFINQLSQLLKGLGGDSGLDIDISIARVRISETLKYPTNEGEPLFIGPAQVTNLALTFGVMIPLIGRDVLSTSFALASREKPLTIFVPPYYGGKAHVLMEVTTRGVRLLEVSMEYGALIPIHWGIATGEASLTAGVFYMVQRTLDQKSGEVILQAFVKAAANLDVAGIIHFCGLVFIALSYKLEGARRLIIGEALVSVSIKIGLVRFSYTFTATHVEEAQGGSAQFAYVAEPMQLGGGPSALGADFVTQGPSSPEPSCQPTMPGGQPGVYVQLLGPTMATNRQDAFGRIVDGYLA